MIIHDLAAGESNRVGISFLAGCKRIRATFRAMSRMNRAMTIFLERIDRRSLLPLAISLVFVFACGTPPPPPIVSPIDHLYETMLDRQADFDLTAVEGRTIVIDPGHGGQFAGTTGRDGLKEKDVNLGVALYLWGLLNDAGADVYLTRSVDRDFLDGDQGGSLTRDLAARVVVADSVDADLFLSVHHNARADTNRDWNRIETYYPADDPGPSIDAARQINHSLLRNLGIADGRIMPGNFYVLRENSSPAVLGESSYLSHPPIERKLLLGEKRRLEAEAYFLGIVSYFASGIPKARIGTPPERVTHPDEMLLEGLVEDEFGGSGIDPTSVRATLDGEPLRIRYQSWRKTVRAPLPPGLSPGEHTITLEGRNRNGNASRRAIRKFRVDLPPVSVALSAVSVPGGDPPVLIIARLWDERGLPIADGTVIRVDDRDRGVVTRNGACRISWPDRNPPPSLHLSGQRFSLVAPLAAEDVEATEGCLFVHDESHLPVQDAAVWLNGRWVGLTRPGGWLPFDEPPGPLDRIRITAPGYQSTLAIPSGPAVVTKLNSIVRSPLQGKTILIDPEGEDSGSPIPESSRALDMARQLAEMVRWSGGVPVLSRQGPTVPPAAQRVPIANRVHADYWITIGFGESFAVTCFPGSREGTPAAAAIGQHLRKRFGETVRINTSAETVLRDTPCPAVRVTIPHTGDQPIETALLRETAHVIIEALGERLTGPDSWKGSIKLRSLAPGALIRIDDEVTFQSWRADSLIIDLPAGTHSVHVETGNNWKEHEVTANGMRVIDLGE